MKTTAAKAASCPRLSSLRPGGLRGARFRGLPHLDSTLGQNSLSDNPFVHHDSDSRLLLGKGIVLLDLKGQRCQSAPFVFVLTIVMLVFALSLSGVFDFGLRATTVGPGLLTRSGIYGSFFAGVLATVVATPCSAPFLAPALGAGLALPLAQSFAVFTVIGLGLFAPLLAAVHLPASTASVTPSWPVDEHIQAGYGVSALRDGRLSGLGWRGRRHPRMVC